MREQGFIPADGGSLYYTAEGSGLPIVLLHGFGLDQRMWDDNAPALAAAGRVIRYDLRGYGQSSLPAGPYSHTEDLRALLAALGCDKAAIVGLSMGGGVAADFALTYPAATRALVLVDATVNGYSFSAAYSASAAAIFGAAQREGAAAGCAAWYNHDLFGPARERAETAGRLGRMIHEYSGWHLINADPGASPEPPAFNRLEDIGAPTLVITGDREVADFQQLAGVLAQRIPGAQKAVVPNAGHMSCMEEPAHFNRTVLGFLHGLAEPRKGFSNPL